MIVNEIHVDGFGILHDRSFLDLEPGINVIVGENEAGKTTLLRFLRFTLFGYPRIVDQRMAPQYGGTHGGRIIGTLSDGERVVCERFAGKHGGSVNFSYRGTSSESETEWRRLLGDATGDLYENVFAFSLDELVGMESLQKSGVDDKIFSIGMGLGNTSIADVESNIRAATDDIYKASGNKNRINQAADEIKALRVKIGEIQGFFPKYKSLAEEVACIEAEIREIDPSILELKRKRERHDNRQKCYESFVEYRYLEDQLAQLPEHTGYPHESVGQLLQSLEELKRLNKAFDEMLNGSDVEKGIADLQREHDSILFNEGLLGDASKIEYLKENLEKYKAAVAERQNDLDRTNDLTSVIKRDLLKISRSWEERDLMDFAEPILKKDRLRSYANKFAAGEKTRMAVEAEIAALGTNKTKVRVDVIASIVAILFLLAALIAFIYGVILVAAAFILAALVVFFGRKYMVGAEDAADPDKKLKRLSETTEKALDIEYRTFLEKELKFDNSLSPQGAMDILVLIEQLKNTIGERSRIDGRMNERGRFISEFEETVSDVRNSVSLGRPDGNVADVVSIILQTFEQNKAEKLKRDRLDEQIGIKNAALIKLQKAIEAEDGTVKSLLKELDADDTDQFLKQLATNNQVEELRAQSSTAKKAIASIAGIDKVDETLEFLDSVDKTQLQSKIDELDIRIQELENEKSRLNEDLGGKREAMRSIEGETELTELMTQLETWKAKLQILYKEWLSLKIAMRMLSDVKHRYEREKQPAVIKNSSQYFQRITKGKYKRISVSLVDKNVSVFDDRESSKKLNELSRGTKEQLLICLRLGFIEEYEQKAEALPLILDDVFVNFDKDRAIETAKVFHRFAEDRQILIFTCHPETALHFQAQPIKTINL